MSPCLRGEIYLKSPAALGLQQQEDGGRVRLDPHAAQEQFDLGRGGRRRRPPAHRRLDAVGRRRLRERPPDRADISRPYQESNPILLPRRPSGSRTVRIHPNIVRPRPVLTLTGPAARRKTVTSATYVHSTLAGHGNMIIENRCLLSAARPWNADGTWETIRQDEQD